MKITFGSLGILAAALLALNTLITLPAAADLRQIDLIAEPQGTVLKLHSDRQLPITVRESHYNRLVLRIDQAGQRATILTNFAQASNVDHVVVRRLPADQVEVTILGHRLSEPHIRFSLMEPAAKPSPVALAGPALKAQAARPTSVVKPLGHPTVSATQAPVASAALTLPNLPSIDTDELAEQSGDLLAQWQPQLMQTAPYGLVGLLILGLGAFIWRKARQLAMAPEPSLGVDASMLPSQRRTANNAKAIPAKTTRPTRAGAVTLPAAPVFMADGSEAPMVARKAVASYQGQTKKSQAATTSTPKATKPVSTLTQQRGGSQPAIASRHAVAQVAESAANPDIQAFLEAVASQMSQDGRSVLTHPKGKKPATTKA